MGSRLIALLLLRLGCGSLRVWLWVRCMAAAVKGQPLVLQRSPNMSNLASPPHEPPVLLALAVRLRIVKRRIRAVAAMSFADVTHLPWARV